MKREFATKAHVFRDDSVIAILDDIRDFIRGINEMTIQDITIAGKVDEHGEMFWLGSVYVLDLSELLQERAHVA